MLGTDKDYLERFQNITRQSVPRVDFHLHTSWTNGANTVREEAKVGRIVRILQGRKIA